MVHGDFPNNSCDYFSDTVERNILLTSNPIMNDLGVI